MNTLLSQGVELMLIGMGVVFVFLMMLVALVSLMSALVGRFVDISVPEAAVPPEPGSAGAAARCRCDPSHRAGGARPPPIPTLIRWNFP